MIKYTDYYYEFSDGVYFLSASDCSIVEFCTFHEMSSYVSDPLARFVEVTPENWGRLYDSGAFHA